MLDHRNEFGEEYFQNHIGEVPAQWVIDLLLKYMSPHDNERLLDVGCGRGYIEKMFADPSRHIDVVSSDVTETARPHIKGQFVLCSMTDMPFPDASFDKVFCLDVLAHFVEGEKGIAEAFRVLKPGGKLLIATPNKYYRYYAGVVQRIRKRTLRFKYDSTGKRFYSKRSLEKALASCQWSSVECFYHQAAPRRFPVDWMRQTAVAVATK